MSLRDPRSPMITRLEAAASRRTTADKAAPRLEPLGADAARSLLARLPPSYDPRRPGRIRSTKAPTGSSSR